MKYLNFPYKLLLSSVFLYTPVVWCIDQVDFSAPFDVSTQLPEYGGAYKGKIEGADNGMLIVVYGDFIEDDPQHYVFDQKSVSERPARDVFVTTCDSVADDCTDSLNWTSPVNLSNTALLSSMQTDWNGDGSRTPYYGDSDNPHIFSSGNHMVISWGDKYCSGGQQRSVTYLEFDSREIPMSCLYVAHASGTFAQLSDWTVDRLSDGSRDVKQDNNKGNSGGVWAVTWQEDPLGLQPGEAEGPGEGSSGAKVSHGTDIWYSYTSNVESAVSDIGVWTTPVRITDNHTGYGLSGSFNPIKNSAGASVNPAQIDRGTVGASRPNLQIVSGSNPPNALLAYEETKGSNGLDEGKFLRYHVFPFNSPPTAAAERAGCIISDPAENARRARFVAQTNAASGSGLRLALFWRQGLYDQGGPADIMLRLGYRSTDAGSTGLNPADLFPAVDPQCATSDYASAVNLTSSSALNVSSHTPEATETNLLDSTDADFLENARAHRAVLRGNDLYLGYIYSEDGVVADATDLANYNFYVRHFNASTDVWSVPENLSNITNTAINVLEPRLMGTPGNGPGCTDPDNISNPENCQDKNVVIAAWGTETNVYEHLGGSENLDIYFTRTTDKAAHWEPLTFLAAGPNSQGESQLRVTPDGNRIFAVWNETGNSGITNTLFSLGSPVTLFSDMALSVPSAPVSVFAGTDFDIDYRLENLGPDRAYDIHLVIDLPASVQYLSADDVCSHDSGVVTCAIGDMERDNSEDIRLSVHSTVVEVLTFNASIESDALDDPQTGNNQVQTVVNSALASDIGLTMVSNLVDVDVGGLTTIHYHLSNTGPSLAESVQLVQALPAGASYVYANPGVCSIGSEVRCDMGDLANGSNTEITIGFRIDRIGPVSFEASVSSDQFDPNTQNNQKNLTITGIPNADLSVQLNVDEQNPRKGDPTVANFAVINIGPQDASDVVLTITIPEGWEQRSLSTSQGSCRIAESTFVCEVSDLDVNGSFVVTLDGTIRGESSGTFQGSVSGSEKDPEMVNNEASITIKFKKDKSRLEKIFGCSISQPVHSNTIFDPTLLILLLFALYRIGRSRFIVKPLEK